MNRPRKSLTRRLNWSKTSESISQVGIFHLSLIADRYFSFRDFRCFFFNRIHINMASLLF